MIISGEEKKHAPRSQERTAGIRQPDAIQVFAGGKIVFHVHGSDYREKDTAIPAAPVTREKQDGF
jgi:hypothetical protein